jgi:carbon starvation protein
VPLLLVLMTGTGSWRSLWTLFGTSNQLLASLSLLGICVWLKKSGKRYAYALLPMLFVGAVTLSSLVLQIRDAFLATEVTAVVRLNGVVAVVLLALALSLFVAGGKLLLSRDGARPAPAV